MRYLSVCSGIGSDAVAWHPLGWETAAFAEIDPQASAVLGHRFPGIPNAGDFTEIGEADHGPVDLVAGGTPCQSFSVAGLRGGMDDDRGNLALEFCRLVGRVRPRWVVWENVPGVLSSNGGRDFGSLLQAMEELGYFGCWRTLDAQYIRTQQHPFAVPQRRRRVFVVFHLGDWRPPVAVLLEPESLRRDPPPRREAGQRVAPTLEARAGVGGAAWGTDFLAGGGLVAGAISAKWAKGSGGPAGDECYNLVPHSIAPALTANPYGDNESREGLLVSHSLRSEGFDASEDGTGRGTPIVAFSCKDHGADAGDVSPTLRAMPHDKSHPNAGGQVAIAIQERAVSENPENGPEGRGWRDDGAAYTLESRHHAQAVAFDPRQDPNPHEEYTGPVDSKIPPQAVQTATMVRRITPLEAERLMGLPDNWTAVPYRGKPMRDGPRYRLIGNGIAINALRWIGERIVMFEKVTA